MAARVGTAYLPVEGDFTPLEKQLSSKLGGRLSGTGRKLGMAVGASIGAGALGAAKGLFEIGQQFDDASDTIVTKTGATGKRLASLQGAFKDVVKDVPTDFASASDAVAGLNQRLGVTGKPLRRLSGQLLELSRITDTDLGENVTSVTRLFGDWGVETDKQSGTLNRLFRLSQATGAEVGDLSQLLVQFGSPLRQLGLDFDFSAAMFARFEKEGVNIQTAMPGLRMALKNFAKDGREPAPALMETFKAIKTAASTAKANTLAFDIFGARAGPDLAAAIREGRFDLDELIKSMRSGDATIRGTARQTEDLTEKWTKFRNEALVKLEPVASRAFDGVSREAGELFKLLNDPKLTTDQKVDEVMDRIGDGIRAAAPALADAAADAAPHAARAFVGSFVDAGPWGRLVLSGLLLRKMGGLGAFRGLGTQSGTAMGQGMATGVATSGLKGRLTGLLRGWGPSLAIGLGAAFGPELAKRIREDIAKTTPDFELPKTQRFFENSLLGPMLGGVIDDTFASDATAVEKFGNTAEDTFRKLQKLGDSRGLAQLAAQARRLAGEFPEVSKELGRFADVAEDSARDAAGSFRDVSRKGGKSLSSIKQATADVDFAIRNKLGPGSRAGKEALAKNMAAAADAVRKSMKSGVISTETGTAEIERLMVRALMHMGFDRKAALNVRKIKPGSNLSVGADGSLRPNQRGGLYQFGSPGDVGPDSILAQVGGQNISVAPGEVAAVFNRHQLPIVNHRLADLGGLPGLFKKVNKPHQAFASGGMVRVPGDPNTTGGRDLVNAAIVNQVAQFIKRFGVQIGYAYDPGHHDSPGHNVTGTALDIHPHTTGWDGVDAAAAAAVKAGKTVYYDGRFGTTNLPPHGRGHHLHIEWGMGGGIAGAVADAIDIPKLARIVATGPDSPLRTLVQGALDTTRSAAQARLKSIASSMTTAGSRNESGPAAIGGEGSGRALMESIARERGWNFADWWELDRRETGHGTDLINEGSGAFNRAQFMPGVTEGQYGPGSLKGASMDEQIRSMAAYIADRYGNPSAALAFHNTHNWYQRGGIVGKLVKAFQTGGLPGLPEGTTALQALQAAGLAPGPPDGLAPTAEMLTRTLRKARKSPDRSAVAKLLKKIKEVGLPTDIAADVERLSDESARFEEFANRANRLTITDEDGNVTLGLVNGLPELHWLGEQLRALFEYRNVIINAEELVVERRDDIAALVEQARTRLAQVAGVIGTGNERKRGLERQLREAEKKPKKNRELIKTLKGQIGELDGRQRVRTRLRDALKDKILPELAGPGGRLEALSTLRGDLLASLDEVQGIGSPSKHLFQLPDVGVLGGKILEAQLSIRDLTAEKPRITDSRDPVDDRGQLQLTQELLRDANLRTAVAEKHFDVLRDMPPYGGSFADGGKIPGPVGAARTIVAHGGEIVLNPDQQAGLGGVQAVEVTVNYAPGTEKFVDVVVERRLRRESRNAGRRLPGGGGLR